MRFSQLFLVTVISTLGVTAFANGPQIEPGPQQKLEESAPEAVDVLLMAKVSDAKAFKKSGNTTKEISRQAVQPGVTIYSFTRQQCSLGGITGGICLGGSRLQVVVREKQSGSMFTVSATSSIQLIK